MKIKTEFDEFYMLTDIERPSVLNVWPITIGKLICRTGIHLVRGNHVCVHVIQKGRGWVKTQAGVVKELKAGDMFCLLTESQLEYFDDPNDPWLYYWIRLDGDDADNLVHQWGFTPELPWIRSEETKELLMFS